MKKTLLSLLVLAATSSVYATDAINNFETSAKIEKFCSISAQDVNFGVLTIPLTSQNANSEMRLLCSNSTKYTIDLQYGGVYGTSTSNGKNYTSSYSSNDGVANYYLIFDKGTQIGSLKCGTPTSAFKNQVFFYHAATANLYGSNINQWKTDTYGACSNGTINKQTLTNFGLSFYSYGIINGAAKGDKIAYYFGLPTDHSKVWNNGNNSYSGTGTGIPEAIALNATIIPSKSSSKYPSEDSYLDTITATITY